jgi:hypothetical protein
MAKRNSDISSSLGGVPEENQERAGIPDSPIFRRDNSLMEASFPPNPVLALHVGGVLVSDLPIEMQGRILYQQTDEGIAENNEGKGEACARVTRDEFSKAMDHRKDRVKEEGQQLADAPNPMKEAMDRHIPKGMRGRFLSPKVVDRRGMRGWEPVLDAEGKQVKVRDQFLGMMPEERAIARNKAVREQGNKLLGQVQEQYLAEGGKTAVSD